MLIALLFVNIHQGYHGSEYTLALIALALMILFQSRNRRCRPLDSASRNPSSTFANFNINRST